MVEIVYRSVKGANLVAAEVDANFQELENRVQAVVDNAPQPVEIVDIVVVGNQMTIIMADYSTFGPFTLPTAVITWHGDWTPNTDLVAYTMFIHNDGLWMTLEALNTGPTFVDGPHYQFLMPTPAVFDIGFFFPQRPGFGIPAGEAICTYLAGRDFFIEADAPGSLARLRDAPTAELVFELTKNDDAIGSITFDAAATTGVFDFVDTQEFAAGDFLRVLGPAVVDDTAIDLNITFVGRLGTP